MSTFDCNFEEFKRLAMDFHKAAPTMNLDELDNSWKCLGLHYLGMYEDMWMTSAATLLNMESKVYQLREMQLTMPDFSHALKHDGSNFIIPDFGDRGEQSVKPSTLGADHLKG